MDEISKTNAGILCDFLEVAIHNILYIRDVYPSSMFQRKKKYGVIVYQSLHPLLNKYINECLKAALFHAQHNQLLKLFVCLNSSRKLIEKFVFDIENYHSDIGSDSFYVKLEQSFRTFCLKLHTSHTILDPIPSDTTFMIQLLTTTQLTTAFTSNPEFEDFPWFAMDNNDISSTRSEIVPLHTVETGSFGVQVYIERRIK